MRRRRSCVLRDDVSRSRGSIAVIVAAAFLPLSMALAVVADGGRVWMEKQKLQDAVEASALAVAQEYALTGAVCSTEDLASVEGKVSCSLGSTANGVVVTVGSSDDVPLRFGGLLGRDTAGVDSSAAVRVGPATSATGLRPLALCQEHSALRSWISSGMTSTAVHSIAVQSVDPGCGGSVPGNWAMLDFNGGANSTSEAREWVADGYPDSVSADTTVPGEPGIPSSSIRLDRLVGRSIVVPVFDNARRTGSNARFDIVGFVQMRIVEVNLSGASSKRDLKVVFERGGASGAIGGDDDPGFGFSSWSVCSFDGRGMCS